MEIQVDELKSTDDYYQYCTLLKQLTAIDPDTITKDAFETRLFTIKYNPFHRIFVAKTADKIIGSITVLIEPKFIHNLSHVAHIEDVIVDKEYRSHGVGARLVNKAIEFSKNCKCYKIILDCDSANSKFYNKFGFVQKQQQMALYF